MINSISFIINLSPRTKSQRGLEERFMTEFWMEQVSLPRSGVSSDLRILGHRTGANREEYEQSEQEKL